MCHRISTFSLGQTIEIFSICVLIFFIFGVSRITALHENVNPTDSSSHKPRINTEFNADFSPVNQNASSESQSFTESVHPPLRDCTFLEGIKYFFEGGFPSISEGSSMLPTLRSNYMIMEKNVSFSDLKVGDIIVFSAPSGEDEVIEHRIIFIDENLSGERVIVTQGDNNPEPIYGIDSPVTEHDYIAKDECVLNR